MTYREYLATFGLVAPAGKGKPPAKPAAEEAKPAGKGKPPAKK